MLAWNHKSVTTLKYFNYFHTWLCNHCYCYFGISRKTITYKCYCRTHWSGSSLIYYTWPFTVHNMLLSHLRCCWSQYCLFMTIYGNLIIIIAKLLLYGLSHHHIRKLSNLGWLLLCVQSQFSGFVHLVFGPVNP